MHQFDLKNRTAIITGGAQGFGFNIAKKFLNSGANVIIWDVDEKKLQSAFKKINNPKLSYNVVDISSFEKVNKIVLEIEKSSKIDILVNNAGITGPTTELWNYSLEDWNKVVEINLNGTFNCCKSIVPNMIKNNYGRIVNIASVAGKEGNANASAYSASKAAVIGLTKSIAADFIKDNIRCNAIAPGTVHTPSWEDRVKAFKDPVQAKKDFIARQPMGRLGTPKEIADLAVYLASDESDFVTGVTHAIDGGMSI